MVVDCKNLFGFFKARQDESRRDYGWFNNYSQWRERFMNYLEEQTDGEAMINSIQNGDQPLPAIAQVSLAGTVQNAPPTLKDLEIWTAKGKKTQKIDHLARSLLIQGISNDIYSLIDSNKTAKDLWDALERQMRGSDKIKVMKKAVVVTSDLLALVAEKTKVSKRKEKVEVQSGSEKSDDDDISDLKKNTALLAKASNRKKYYAKPTNNNLRTSSASSSANKKPEYIKSEGHFAKDCKKAKVKDYNYYKRKMLLAKKDSDEKVLLAEDQAWMESSSNSDQEINANMVFMAQIEKNADLLAQTKVLQDQLKVKHVVINTHTECQAQYGKLEEERYEYMIRYSALYDNDKQHRKKIDEQEILFDKMSHQDTFYNGRKGIGFENPSYFEKAKDLRPSLYDEKVIGLGHTLMFLIHSDEALEFKEFKRGRENKIEFAYDYGNLNAKNQSENDCQVVEKECHKMENSRVIALGMFKLNVSQSVSPISISKTSCDSKNVKNLDTFSSVRRHKQSNVIWKKKGSSNTSNVDLSIVSHLKLNKDVKRYSRKDLLSCNNSHLGETSSAYICNDAMNVSCNSGFCDSFDENNLFIFDEESVRISPVSKMPFWKKPCDFMNVCSKSNSNKSLPRTVHRWLPKMQPLAEPIAKWIPKIVQICLWIIDSGCSKHMMGNPALLTNFVENFLGTVRFGNNDFAVIVGYGDVVIRSITIKKVYYGEGLGHNLFSVGQFCDNGLEVAFRKSTYGVDLLTDDRSSNLYTIALNEVASNSLTCLLAKAFSSQSWFWHQHLSHLNFATINNLVKNNLFQGLPKMKFEKDHLCSACEQRKIHRKHHKSKTAFASNKPLYPLHMDLCGPMRVESINRKRYVLVIIDDYSRYTWAEAIAIACFTQNHLIIHKRFDKTPYELMNKRKPNIKFFRVFGCKCYLLNDYEDVRKLKEKGDIRVFVGYLKESAAFRIYNKRTQGSSSSSLNNDVHQSLEEVVVLSLNIQSISNNMIPNVDEASTSHNVFNKRLEDACFDASTLFHDLSNVHTFYQPYPHEKKWIKDHPLHKIISDPKSSVHTRGQLANSCLFSCLLSFIEPTNVAEALRDTDWVSAMQDELDQFARLKVWRLVP
nr:hypothetical protein [Tanacetum cinerariifolium]